MSPTSYRAAPPRDDAVTLPEHPHPVKGPSGHFTCQHQRYRADRAPWRRPPPARVRSRGRGPAGRCGRRAPEPSLPRKPDARAPPARTTVRTSVCPAPFTRVMALRPTSVMALRPTSRQAGSGLSHSISRSTRTCTRGSLAGPRTDGSDAGKASDPGGLQPPGEHAEGLEQIVGAPDQLVPGGQTDPAVIAAVAEDAALV